MKQSDQTDHDELRPEYGAADFAGAVRGKYAGKRPDHRMTLSIECWQQGDGRWQARVAQLPAATDCADSREDAIGSVEQLAVAAMAERVGRGESAPVGLNFAISDLYAAPRDISG